MTHKSHGWWICALVGLWLGFMISTAGMAAYHPFAKLAGPFVCKGEFKVDSVVYVMGYPRTYSFTCQEAGKPVREMEDEVWKYSMILYSISGALIGFLLWVFFRFIKMLR